MDHRGWDTADLYRSSCPFPELHGSGPSSESDLLILRNLECTISFLFISLADLYQKDKVASNHDAYSVVRVLLASTLNLDGGLCLTMHSHDVLVRHVCRPDLLHTFPTSNRHF